MTTGRVTYLDGPESVQLKEYELPTPADGDVLAEIVRANVCGSELHIWRGEHPYIDDGVLGHEALCRVVETGGDVRDSAGNALSPGDLIVPAYFATCGECVQCGRGNPEYCENAYKYWSRSPDEWPHFHGTFGTHYYVHDDQYAYRVPSDVDETAAAAANCALSQVLHGLGEVDLTLDETVVIQGAGGLGLNATAVATELGAETIVVDGVAQRLDRAREFGADHTIDLTEYETVEARCDRVHDLTDGLGADVAVEVTGVPAAIDEGFRLLGKGGRYLVMGNIIPGKEATIDPGLAVRKSVEVTTTMRYAPWRLHDALGFLSKHGDDYPFDELVDASYPLSDVDGALRDSANREVTRAALVTE
ncbi:zinc-binding dehydrogenase [Halorubrum sp. CBA1125]|uniref:zinc-binding dehydrogenase n=1 Tax=Halorubrum sp. CBA1125 TaxID=2668072 RepID=UPI0012E88CAB|nr:zinc-binding dehydrogenase [Halorubrum sp. CBA1125]MUW13764.1 zinc-binding dehydrogenase [Halorubrum sp. CBA1125]